MLNSADNPAPLRTHEPRLLTAFHCTSHCTPAPIWPQLLACVEALSAELAGGGPPVRVAEATAAACAANLKDT